MLKNLYTPPPPHLYECFSTVNSEHCISQDPELLFPLVNAYFCFKSTKWLFVLEQYAEFDLLFVLQLEYLRQTDPKPFFNPNQ